uniref:DDE Tnp4 domain-containing protein n=1 Tax=Leptobrachium leishanense TaxID=445787 RepID=A0A8C5QLD1_9ANUR
MDMNMDPDELVIMAENPYLIHHRLKRKRRFWVNPILVKRSRLGEFHHLRDKLQKDAAKFFDYYRMSLETFTCILDAIRPFITKSSDFRDPISPEERLTVTLRYLATGSSFKTLGYSFRISDVTVGRIVLDTCKAIWDKLQPLHLGPIVDGFWKRWCFPNCLGCIDGKHIRILNPKHSGTIFSIVLQSVAGLDYRFIAVDVGADGKESDGGIFSNANLSRQLEWGALGVHRHTTLPGTEIMTPCVILGDDENIPDEAVPSIQTWPIRNCF